MTGGCYVSAKDFGAVEDRIVDNRMTARIVHRYPGCGPDTVEMNPLNSRMEDCRVKVIHISKHQAKARR